MLSHKRKPMYPGGDPNYIENVAKYYANRVQNKPSKNIVYYSGYVNTNYYSDDDDDYIKLITFKTPKHEWQEEWYQSDINCISSDQAWIRYIKLRDLQLFAEDNNETNNWKNIKDLIEQHPFIFEHNKYGYEFGDLCDEYYKNESYDDDDYDDDYTNDETMENVDLEDDLDYYEY